MDIQKLFKDFTDRFKTKYYKRKGVVLAGQEQSVQEKTPTVVQVEEPVEDRTRADIVAAVLAAILSEKTQQQITQLPLPPPPPTEEKSPENIVAAAVTAVSSAEAVSLAEAQQPFPPPSPEQNSPEIIIAAVVAAVLAASQGTPIKKQK